MPISLILPSNAVKLIIIIIRNSLSTEVGASQSGQVSETFTCAISFFVAQKLMKDTLTKSEPKQTVTVFSSNVS